MKVKMNFQNFRLRSPLSFGKGQGGRLILIAVMIVVSSTVSHAGGFNPGNATPGSGTGSNGQIPQTGSGSGAPGAVPFDGGLSLILLAAGAGLKAKRRTHNA